MVNSLIDLDRRKISLVEPRVREVLPEYFLSEYPSFVQFLEKYYEFLDSDADVNFTQSLQNILSSRDILETDIRNLDLILAELSGGAINSSYFSNPRYATRLLGEFFRAKGSLYSAEAFFKAFYGIDATIEYPKRNIFIVDQSLIGPEDLSYIQDGALYQVFSVLVKSELPITTWGDLYKQFVHPAGFFLGSEVSFTGVASMLGNPMPVVEDLTAEITTTIVATADTSTSIAPVGDYTGIVSIDSAGTLYRIGFDNTLENYKDVSLAALDNMYPSLASIVSASSPTFDDSDNTGGMDVSNAIETFDEVEYVYYDSTP